MEPFGSNCSWRVWELGAIIEVLPFAVARESPIQSSKDRVSDFLQSLQLKAIMFTVAVVNATKT